MAEDIVSLSRELFRFARKRNRNFAGFYPEFGVGKDADPMDRFLFLSLVKELVSEGQEENTDALFILRCVGVRFSEKGWKIPEGADESVIELVKWLSDRVDMEGVVKKAISLVRA